ncbi:MAG: tetratricopeptide repeat protein [Oculatellaceae cyanobacterium bins.114]|nr:tetratricopeptide repeat protein [Oculatellaceae cyanobacterium bins.114]
MPPLITIWAMRYKPTNNYLRRSPLTNKAIDLNPDYATAYYNLGNALQANQQLPEAIAAYQKAINLKSDDADAYIGLGNALSDNQQLPEAIAAYQKAIDLKSDDADAHNGLGWVYLLKGELEQAKVQFETAIQLDANYYSPVLNLGLVYALQGDQEETRNYKQRGLALWKETDDWDEANQALCIFALGEPEQGMAEMQAVIQSGISVEILKDALKGAEMLVRCPVKPEGIDQMVEMLRGAIH